MGDSPHVFWGDSPHILWDRHYGGDCPRIGKAADGADFGSRELGSEVSDGFFAVTLGLGGDAATAHKNQVGDGGRAGARPSQVDDFVAGGAVVGFEVEGFGAVEAAAKCDERDFHLF